MSSTARYDATADSIKISSYRGTTLLGPQAQLTKKIYANEGYTAANSQNFTTSSFRILGTAAGSLLDAKVYLVCPFVFGSLAGAGLDNVAINAPNLDWNQAAIGPRRGGLWRAFSSVSTTVNSSVSFNVRPREEFEQMDAIFSDGSLPSEMGNETGTLGPDHCVQPEIWSNVRNAAGTTAVVQANGAALLSGAGGVDNEQAYGEFAEQFGAGNPVGVNTAFARRRADFLSGITDDQAEVNYDMVTCLHVPPFASWKMEPYQRAPTSIPWVSSIDVTCHWESIEEVKSALMITKASQQGTAQSANGYSLNWRSKPYLLCVFRQPPFTLTRPVSIGAYRTVSYTLEKTTANIGGTYKVQCDLSNIRFDSWPPLLVITAERSTAKALPQAAHAVGQGSRYRDNNDNLGAKHRDYYCPLSNLSITVNERQKIMTDFTDYELYQMFKRNTRSKYSFRQWRDCKCCYVIRASDMCLETGENVYDPVTLSVSVMAANAVGDGAVATDIRLRILSIYTSESLTMSSQSASVTSLLLSKTDYRDVVAGKRPKEPEQTGPSISDYS